MAKRTLETSETNFNNNSSEEQLKSPYNDYTKLINGMKNFNASFSISEYKNLLTKQYIIKEKFNKSQNYDLLKYMFDYSKLQEYKLDELENNISSNENEYETIIETIIKIIKNNHMRKLYFFGIQMVNSEEYRNVFDLLEKLKNEFCSVRPYELEREIFEDDFEDDFEEDITPASKKIKKEIISKEELIDKLLRNAKNKNNINNTKNINDERILDEINKIEQDTLKCCYIKKMFELSKYSKIEYFKKNCK